MGEYRKELMALMKQDGLGNKHCVDCGAPNPQWASIPFGIYICLAVSSWLTSVGGIGLIFNSVQACILTRNAVRSITMDEWSEDQMKKMRAGGNSKFTTFVNDYTPAELGGYREGMATAEKYNTWAATQYKEKLTADIQGQDWAPSAPPEGISRPSSAQGVRKSRTGARGLSSLRNDSGAGDLDLTANSSSTSVSDAAYERKTANEAYFERLGGVNANRREDLPPSQGGKYTGFGSTPAPSMNNPAYGTSSAALPSLGELQNEPVAALSKGWSFLSAAVSAAGKIVAEKAMDPTLHENVKGYVSQAGKMAMDTGHAANEWSKRELGVDVADNISHATERVKDGLGIAQHPGEGYETIGSAPNSGMGWAQEGNALYAEGGDDFFDRHGAGDSPLSWKQPDTALSTGSMATEASENSATSPTPATGAKKKDDWDKDDWADW